MQGLPSRSVTWRAVTQHIHVVNRNQCSCLGPSHIVAQFVIAPLSMRHLMFVVLLGCGEATLVAHVECTGDAACPVGQVCSPETGQCVVVDGGDLSSWPAPDNSAVLLERFRRMVLAADGGSGEQQLTFGGGSDTQVSQTIGAASAQAQVLDARTVPQLQLWGVSAVGAGGTLQLWPPAGRSEPVMVPIQTVTVTLQDPLTVPLQLGDYPTASAHGTASCVVTARIGNDAEHTVGLTTTLPDANVEVRFAVVEQTTQMVLRIQATAGEHDGAEAWLGTKAVTLEVTLKGPAVPASWLAK